MAQIAPPDRVLETSTTTGVGAYTLAGAVAGYRAASAVAANLDTIYYYAEDVDTNGVPLGGWETGLGTWGTGSILTRTTIHASSNANAAVSWAAGTRRIALALTAAALALKQDALVSGTNIKTINGSTLLGSGDLVVSGSPTLTISNKTAAYTVVAGDNGTIINCTSGTFTVSLTAAATLGSGFNCWIINSGTGAITINPNGVETIDGHDTPTALRTGEGYRIVCTGTAFKTIGSRESHFYSENLGSEDGTVNWPNASGAYSLALHAQATASGTFSFAAGPGATASASSSTAIGINSAGTGSQAVTGAGAMALGGSYASGTDSFAAAIANNTSTYGAIGNNSVAIGLQARAGNTYATAIGGYGNAASSTYTTCLGGAFNTSSQAYAISMGIYAVADKIGKFAFATGQLANPGDAQTGTMVLRVGTSDAIATILTSNNSAASTTNQVILPNNSAYTFTGEVISKKSGTADVASWKVEGVIVRGANAAATTLVASAINVISNVPGWTLALTADTTNGGLAVTFTGAAATNIRTVATIRTSEVTY